MHNERRRGKRPGAAIEYLRRTWSGAAGDDLSTTMKYIRGAADIGLGNTINYLRRKTSSVAENGRAQRSSTCDAQGAAPLATTWAPRFNTFAAPRASAWVTLIKHLRRTTSVAARSVLAPRASTCNKQRAASRAMAWTSRSSTCGAQRAVPRAAAWYHDEVPATNNKRRRGQRPGATIKYLRGAADIGLGTTIKHLQQTTSGAAGSGLAPR